MPYEFYKILHFFGIFCVLASLGGIGTHILAGGTRENFSARKWLGTLHGMGLLLVLIAGFGLHARLLPGLPIQNWAWAKLCIWVLLGMIPLLYYRKPKFAKLTWWLTIALASLAGLFAVLKPF